MIERNRYGNSTRNLIKLKFGRSHTDEPNKYIKAE